MSNKKKDEAKIDQSIPETKNSNVQYFNFCFTVLRKDITFPVGRNNS